MLNIALPKGRLGEKVYRMLAAAGYPCPALLADGRRLTFENEMAGVRYFWAKPSDVHIYVERGVAELGIVGKDILAEYQPDVYELLDLNIGRCRMAVAAKEGFRDHLERSLRVATKFPNIAGKYYNGQGRNIDVIRLSGSIELAPVLGLSDVIVDIVETGTTLRENHLSVIETIMDLSARLIANRSSFKFQNTEIRMLMERLDQVLRERTDV